MEEKELLARWHVLLNEPGNAIAVRSVLEERLAILHRLNELGVYEIEGVSLIKALEETNVLMRETYRASPV
jgi:hypothetical protein